MKAGDLVEVDTFLDHNGQEWYKCFRSDLKYKTHRTYSLAVRYITSKAIICFKNGLMHIDERCYRPVFKKMSKPTCPNCNVITQWSEPMFVEDGDPLPEYCKPCDDRLENAASQYIIDNNLVKVLH